jgi:CubicO group peptidase (beta-lactamase class C family)
MYELNLKLIDPQALIFEVSNSNLTSSTLTYPASTWVTAEPKTVGVDMTKLQKAIDYAFDDVVIDGVPKPQYTQGLVIVRHGVIIAEKYGANADKEAIATSWSTAKSFTSALTGIAIKNGSIGSVDTPASEFITEWRAGETKDITIKNLLMMSSGLQEFGNDSTTMYIGSQNDAGAYEIVDNVKYSIENRQADPDLAPWLGSSYNWNYQNADTQIVGESIERATGKSLAEFAETELFSKIGMSAGWWKDGFDNYMPWCCIDATTRDFARFGLLYAREGKWQGSAVVPAAWVTESTKLSTITSPALKVGYGYFWWPHVDGEWFYAAGSRSNNIYVHPGLDLVVARNSTLEFLGDETAKDRAKGAHRTLFPEKWDHEEFFELVIDSVNQ